MILFSSDKLEKALVSGSVDSWQKTKYVILYLAIGALSGEFPLLIHLIVPTFGPAAPPFTTFFSLVPAVLATVITCIGVRKCYVSK